MEVFNRGKLLLTQKRPEKKKKTNYITATFIISTSTEPKEIRSTNYLVLYLYVHQYLSRMADKSFPVCRFVYIKNKS